jgi:hypothetical protein
VTQEHNHLSRDGLYIAVTQHEPYRHADSDTEVAPDPAVAPDSFRRDRKPSPRSDQ